MKLTREDLPYVECEVTFLSEKDGGRKSFNKGMLLDYQYRPLLVVGDINQCKAILSENNYLMEEHLAISFFGGPDIFEPNVAIKTKMALMYFPKNQYEKLIPNATFTIREGPQVVAFGTVIKRIEP